MNFRLRLRIASVRSGSWSCENADVLRRRRMAFSKHRMFSPSRAKLSSLGAHRCRGARNLENSAVPTLLARGSRGRNQSVEELRRELVEAREQQAATAAILAGISSSPTDPTDVFAEIAASADRFAGALLIRAPRPPLSSMAQATTHRPR